jgi:hypothetical protein
MTIFNGKLGFISFLDTIKLERENGIVDLREAYFQVFNSLNGKKCSMDGKMNSLKILADENSDRVMKFERNEKEDTILMLLEIPEPGWGMSNLGAYVPSMLERLNGMQVIVKYDNESISVEHDETEKVFEIKYTGDGNSCKVEDDKVKEICKPGQVDACIFLSAGPEGFECQKFNSPMARVLLDRYSNKIMRASRIGNCKIIGRMEK